MGVPQGSGYSLQSFFIPQKGGIKKGFPLQTQFTELLWKI
jgi:hypothetical protein